MKCQNFLFPEKRKILKKKTKKLELSEDLNIALLQHYQSFLAFIVPEKSVTKIFKNGKI